MTEDLTNAVNEVLEAAGRLDAAGKYLTGRFFIAQIAEEIARTLKQNDSPFVDREAAAARWFCSKDEIDRAADDGILTRLHRGASPLFEKAEGDAAVREGRWFPMKASSKKKAA